MDYGLDIAVTGIAGLLDDKMLVVPPYQRPYAWETDHVDAFWRDLRQAMDESSTYFLGSVVLSDSGDAQSIVDGQQRVTTATLLLCAIRDYFLDKGESDNATVVLTEHLGRRRLAQADLMPRLRLGIDDEFFQSLLLRAEARVPSAPGELRLAQALEALSTRLAEDLESAHDPAVRCDAWIDFLRRRALVIRVTVSNESDAYSIFETLNDRGIALNTTDLLRNFLLSRVPSSDIAVQTERWNRSIDDVTAVGDDQAPVTFIRHYWSSRQGATRERDLYRSIRSSVTTPEDAVGLVDEVRTASRAYSALLDPSHEFWAEYSPEARGLAAVLSHLDLARVRPLVLALMLTGGDMAEAMFNALARWLPRGLLSSAIGGSVAERAFASAAVGVRTGEVTDTADLQVRLSALIPSDERFSQAFGVYRLRRPQLGAYVLTALRLHDPSPYRPGLALTDWTVVPVYSPGLAQQLDSTSSFVRRQLDGLRESFANYVLVEPAAAQALKGASGETRIGYLTGLTDVPMPPPSSDPADAVAWLETRLSHLRETAIGVWAID